jgi:HAD superfamily hydrolase (TIGR01509 family)
MPYTAPVIDTHALLFDMDGLMVDSEPLWFDVERDFARARGGDWTDELADACIGKGLANTLRVMSATFGFAIDQARDQSEIIDRFLAGASGIAIKPGCRELLDAARGVVPLAAASSSARRLVHGVLEGLSLAPYFDAIVTGDDVVHPKPAPDIFLEAARRLGVDPPGCVVLEDSLAGATAGHAAGMPVIAVPEHETPGIDRVATHVVRDLYEARALLQLVQRTRQKP